MPRTLTDQESENIAILATHPGYALMIEIMEDGEKQLLEDMGKEGNAASLLVRTRHWQTYHQFLDGLRRGPREFLQELTAMREAMDTEPRNLEDAMRRKLLAEMQESGGVL